jgi:hypothetical protein
MKIRTLLLACGLFILPTSLVSAENNMVRTEIKQGNSTATIVQSGDPKAATVKVKRAPGTVIIHQRSGNSSATVIQMDGSAAER